MNSNRSTRVVRLGAAALAAGFLATAVLALPASAAPGPGNIDPDQPVSLSIHKRTQPDVTGTPGDGTQLPTAPGQGLPGVTFSVQKVTSLDLLDPADWNGLENLTAAQVLADSVAYPLGADVGGVTDANGDLNLTAPAVEIGVYLVQETDAPANVISRSLPFLVTLPMPGPGQNPLWNYDVHVYPKNAVAGDPIKQVDDAQAFQLGDAVSWTIQSPVAVLTANEDYSEYVISDDLDSRLDYTGATVSWDGDVALTAADYTITPAAATATGPVVTVTFTASGLAKLDAQTTARTISVVVDTTVNSIGDGSIENIANTTINGNDRQTNEVITHWGAFDIRKHEANNTANTLAGAVFDLYTVEPTADNAPVAPIWTGTTEEDGTFEGIAPKSLKVGTYWLVERVAPAGYQLPAAFADRVSEITITEGDIDSVTAFDIANVQQPPYTLPLTGGTGGMIFTVTGAALLIGGAAFYLVSRRRTAQREQGATRA